MNSKRKIFEFTLAVLSSTALVNPALAGWANFADDAFEALGRLSRKYGDDVVSATGKQLDDDIVTGTVRVTRQATYDQQTGNIIAPFLVGGVAGYSLVVNCNNQTAYWINPEAQYENVNFNSVRGYYCGY